MTAWSSSRGRGDLCGLCGAQICQERLGSTRDLILELPDLPNSLACHVRHYVHNDLHVVVVGQLRGGLCPIASAASVASEVTETVIPHEGFGVRIAKVGDGLPRDVSAVIAAVDRSCAAYECTTRPDPQSRRVRIGTSCHVQSRGAILASQSQKRLTKRVDGEIGTTCEPGGGLGSAARRVDGARGARGAAESRRGNQATVRPSLNAALGIPTAAVHGCVWLS